MKPLVVPALFGILIFTAAWGKLEEQEWLQWAQNPQHTGFALVEGQAPEKQLADIVYDPFVAPRANRAIRFTCGALLSVPTAQTTPITISALQKSKGSMGSLIWGGCVGTRQPRIMC